MKSKTILLGVVLFMLMLATLMSFLLMNKIDNFSSKGSSSGATINKPPQDVESDGDQSDEITQNNIFEMYSCPTLRSAADCSLSFKATMSLDLFDSILMDENKSIYTLFAPLDIFEQVVAYIMENSDLNPLVDDIDWYVWFLWSGQHCELIPYDKGLTINGNVCEITASLTNIKFKNVNRPYLGVTYFEDKGTSEWDRTYAKFPEGENLKSYARSLSYLVAEKLNRNKYGLSLTETELSNMQLIMSWSIDQLKGLEEASSTISSYDVKFSKVVKMLKTGETEEYSVESSSTAEIHFEKGEEAYLSFKVSPENNDLPFLWCSFNNNVVTVEGGMLTAVGVGESIVQVCFAGKTVDCVVVVKESSE